MSYYPFYVRSGENKELVSCGLTVKGQLDLEACKEIILMLPHIFKTQLDISIPNGDQDV
jgi:hypothetical protein